MEAEMIGPRLALLAAVLAVAVNLSLTVPATVAPAGETPASEAQVDRRLARMGFDFSHNMALTRGGSHRARLFRNAASDCEVMVLPMTAPDEVLAMLRRRLNADAWDRRQLWVAQAAYRIDAAWEVHWLRVRHRLAGDHVGAGPYLVVPARTCPADAI
jgi:hypothetical protein